MVDLLKLSSKNHPWITIERQIEVRYVWSICELKKKKKELKILRMRKNAWIDDFMEENGMIFVVLM